MIANETVLCCVCRTQQTQHLLTFHKGVVKQIKAGKPSFEKRFVFGVEPLEPGPDVPPDALSDRGRCEASTRGQPQNIMTASLAQVSGKTDAPVRISNIPGHGGDMQAIRGAGRPDGTQPHHRQTATRSGTEQRHVWWCSKYRNDAAKKGPSGTVMSARA